MSLRGIRYLLKSEGFQAKRKIKTNFVNASNKRKRIAWDRNHQHYTADDWGKWGFSKETRINMWSSVGKSYYWTDGATELLPHQIEPHVQGDGGSVLFWGLITEEGPGYGSTITEGDVSTEVYIDILQTSLLEIPWSTMSWIERASDFSSTMPRHILPFLLSKGFNVRSSP